MKHKKACCNVQIIHSAQLYAFTSCSHLRIGLHVIYEVVQCNYDSIHIDLYDSTTNGAKSMLIQYKPSTDLHNLPTKYLLHLMVCSKLLRFVNGNLNFSPDTNELDI